MNSQNLSPGKQVSQQALELSIAAPQVVAHRFAQMAMAGTNPSASDQKEFQKMSHEKVTAFYESWSAMWAQMFKSQLAISKAITGAFTSAVMTGKSPSATSTLNAMTHEAHKVISAGIEPVHRTTMSNAKRLARGK